jgi:hypothetical protein
MVATCSRDDFRAARADWIANPLVNLTHYGRRCLAAPGLGVNCPSVASQHLPTWAGYRAR